MPEASPAAIHDTRTAALSRAHPGTQGTPCRRMGRSTRAPREFSSALSVVCARFALLAALGVAALTSPPLVPTAAAQSAAPDPLKSPSWTDVRLKVAGTTPLVFDPRVEVLAPAVAEDSLNVPVTIALKDLPDVQRVLVIADLNPILKVLEFEPLRAMPRLSFRLKLQQGSPVRALALTTDGVWHAGGVWVDAAGGGCTAPSVGRSSGTWADTLGEVDARWWEKNDSQRLKFRVMHPMDTGLAPGIPAFFIERLALRDKDGNEWARIVTYEPVSENPLFSLEFDNAPPDLTLVGTDNNGNRINVDVRRGVRP